MSSLFSIGEDEMDLDDEDFLLAACVTGSSVHCSTDNSKMDSVLQQDRSTNNSKTQLLRTKEVEKFNNHYSRRPFESLCNTNSNDRVSEKKRSSTEPIHRSFSFTSTTVLQRNNATSSTNGFHAPLAKRFAFDNNSSPQRLSENMASLLRSSSTPSIKTSESTSVMHNSDKSYPCNSSSFQRNLSSGDSQLQEFSKCNLRPGDSLESNKRLDPSNKVSMPYNSTSNFLSTKELSVLNSPSISTGFRSLHNSKAREIKTASPVWQQKGAVRCSPATKSETGNSPLPMGNTSSSLCNQTERHSGNTFHGNLDGTKASKTPVMFRQKGYASSNTPQGHQASTPIVNRSHSRNPSVSKTPTPRKFPGPAGLLPKLNPGQKLDDTSLVSPLPSMTKKSPVENKFSQSNSSEDDDFNRDPWTYMHRDFLKNVPLAKRYTIVKVYNEAIQQRLEQGKVPCLCALVKAFSLTEADASVLLKDPTGEIHGTLHRKVLEDFQTELAPGAGLILKHVSVFSPAPRKHYLNITPGNILHIYPPDPQFTSSQTLASQCTQADSKQEEQRVVIEEEVISEQAHCYQETSTSYERPSVTEKEKEWIEKDCFEDLLEGLDDDDDFLDEALLV